MAKKEYGIDIELPDGITIISGKEAVSVHAEAGIDIELPKGYSDKKSQKASSKASKAEEVEPKRPVGIRARRRIANTIIYIILVLMTVIWLFPFVGIVLESFRCESTYRVGYLWPKQWGFDNYVNLFTYKDGAFIRWFGNTIAMGMVCAVLQTVICLSVSYALSRMRFKGRKGLMYLMLILGMFPGFLTLILLYKFFSNIGLTEEYAPVGLIIIYVASSGMGYYISKGFFDTVSKSLDEAAMVDGATRFQVFYKIILPMAKPIIIYTILMAFMAPFGDFVMAKYMAHSNLQGMNVAVGLQWLISTDQSMNANYTMFCAGGVVVAVPITILFMCLQKYYVAGVTGGAVKG